jgi:hypothetical protein
MNIPNGQPYHYYHPGDPVPQLVRVVNGCVWLPDAAKSVEVARLQGKLVRLVEVKEGEAQGDE